MIIVLICEAHRPMVVSIVYCCVSGRLDLLYQASTILTHYQVIHYPLVIANNSILVVKALVRRFGVVLKHVNLSLVQISSLLGVTSVLAPFLTDWYIHIRIWNVWLPGHTRSNLI